MQRNILLTAAAPNAVCCRRDRLQTAEPCHAACHGASACVQLHVLCCCCAPLGSLIQPRGAVGARWKMGLATLGSTFTRASGAAKLASKAAMLCCCWLQATASCCLLLFADSIVTPGSEVRQEAGVGRLLVDVPTLAGQQPVLGWLAPPAVERKAADMSQHGLARHAKGKLRHTASKTFL